MRRSVLTILSLVVLGVLAGCGSPAQPATGPHQDTPPAQPATAPTATGSPVVTPTSSPTGTAPVPAGSPAASPVRPGLTPLTPSTPGTMPTGTPVDPAAYRGAGGYYFGSPNGSVYCGVLTVGSQVLAGCQSMAPMPDQLPQCGSNPSLLSPTLQWPGQQETLAVGCLSQGVFVGQDARVLPAGSSFSSAGYTFVATRSGIHASNVATHQGFVIQPPGYQVFVG